MRSCAASAISEYFPPMANPALQAFVDWDANGNYTGTYDDVSAKSTSPPGTPILSIARGANMDGAALSPGTCTLRLLNTDNKYTPGNAASPIAGLVRPGVPIRIRAVYNSTTYPLFEGTVRRIVPVDDLPVYAELYAEDEGNRFAQRTISRALDETLNIWQFREALLTAYGLTAGQMSLSKSGPEISAMPTAADEEKLADVLGALNRATRTIDFIRPTATGFQYVTKDRVTLEGSAAAASYAATQIAEFSGWDATDDARLNYQLVQAEPFLPAEEQEELWASPRQFHLAAGETKIFLAHWGDPVLVGGGRRRARNVTYEAAYTGTATISSFAAYSTSARLQFSGGASGGTIGDLKIFGHPAQQTGLGYVESDRSAGDPLGIVAGAPISSPYLATDTDAKGLADYLTWLGSQPLVARPSLRLIDNLFPDIFVREPGDRITVANGRLNLSGQSMIVEGLTLQMFAGGIWRLGMRGQLMPALSIVQIGGDAAHGIGGTAILGY